MLGRVEGGVRGIPAWSQGRHRVSFNIGDQVSQAERGVSVDRARGGLLHTNIGQLGQVELHISVVLERRGGGVLGQVQGVAGGGEREVRVRQTNVAPGRKAVLVSRTGY